MIKPYIVELQSRVRTLQELIGNLNAYDIESKICKQKFEEIVGKISANKQISRKYQKLSSFIQKYADPLDSMFTADKLNIVLDELESLSQSAQVLMRIQKNLPSLEVQDRNKNQKQFGNMGILTTASSVKYSEQVKNINIVKYNSNPLTTLLEQQRGEINSIMELNYRIVNNLNEKIRLAYQNKLSKK